MPQFLKVLIVCGMMLPASANAQQWQHAVAPMGQKEGGFDAGNGAQIGYGCINGMYGNFGITLPGAIPGRVMLKVDDKLIARVEMTRSYDGKGGAIGFDVKDTSPRKMIATYNQVILAVAEGAKLTISKDDGKVIKEISLKGSAQIRHCVM